eukprot:4915764-Pleurochrysis_carterae.AAC.1
MAGCGLSFFKGAHAVTSCFGILRYPRTWCVWEIELAGATHAKAGHALVKWAQSIGEAAEKTWAVRGQHEQTTAP